MRWAAAAVLPCIAAGFSPLAADESTALRKGREYTVAIYYWPNFHRDAYHQSKKGEGWTEWDIVKKAKPKFNGHPQPKTPLWGYRDESDPREMARSIDAMANAGIGAIIFDWYRYDDDIQDGVMIEKALNQGFLQAPNRNRVKFALMWANHTYIDCHPFAPGVWFNNAPVWRNGEVSRAAFERHTQDAILSYFKQPNYWKIDGCPYFSIYDLEKLVRGLGGLAATRATLDDFRRRVKTAGFPDLHLNIVDQASLENALKQLKGQPFPDKPARKVETAADLLAALKVDSSTMYTWVHHVWPMLVKQADQSATKPAVETRGNAFGFADNAGSRPHDGRAQSQTDSRTGVELVHNGGFEDGLAGWGKLQRVDLEVVAGGAPGKAVKVTHREGRYSSPVQSVRSALERSGPGYYELSISLKAVSQPDKMFGVVRIEDNAGPRWFPAAEAEVTAGAFKKLTVRNIVQWNGTLKSAEIYFASHANVDVLIDNFSLVRLPESELAKITLLERAALAGITAADYGDYGRQAMRVIDQRPAALGVTYFPHVSMGWDGSPRNYSMGMVLNNTPAKWGAFLRQTKDWLDRHPESKRIVTLNSWNEWVEGSYIEPDTVNGKKYLDAVRDVFGTPPVSEPVQAVAYYFPCWGATKDQSESEWTSMAKAQPRFPGHAQPKSPLWGMLDERDPKVMAQKIDAAADHGLKAFVFCWYAYEGGKRFLDGALRKGFLEAANRSRLDFALLWANADVGGYGTGKVKLETWEGIMDEVIRDYFSQPNYWRVDGRPYFSIYLPNNFVASFGSVEKAASALQRFRAKATSAGLPGIHLNAILNGISPQQAKLLGFDSLTSYVWTHHYRLPTFPTSDYANLRNAYFSALDEGGWANGLERPTAEYGLPYFPNVTMGWDSSPRCPAGAPWDNKPVYPFGPVVVNNTPAAFGDAVRQAIRRLDAGKTTPRIITIYAWNEWTEGGFLEPEKRTGMSYLEALRQVLPPAPSTARRTKGAR